MKWTVCTLFLGVLLSGCIAAQTAVSPTTENQALALVDQGVAHLNFGELDRAEASFEMAHELARLPQALDGLGCVAFLRSEWRKAERYFIRAYEADHSYTEALGNLALLYDVQDLSDESEKLYRFALAENPENFRLRNNFAGFLAKKNREGSALKELKRAQALAEEPIIVNNIETLEN